MKSRQAQFKLSIVAVLLMLSMLFGSCTAKKPDDQKQDQTVTDEQGIPAGVDLQLIKDGLANFEIVLPENPTENEQKAADTLKKRFESSVDTVDAKIVTAGKYDEKKIEILIGQSMIRQKLIVRC